MREGHNRGEEGHSSGKWWWFNRFYCLALIIISMVFLLEPIPILTSNFIVPFFDSSASGQAVCEDLGYTLIVTISCGVLLPFMFIAQWLVSSKWYIKLWNWFVACVFVYVSSWIPFILAYVLQRSLIIIT